MEFNIYDIYVDASIDLDTKIGCAGAVIVDRKKDVIVNESYGLKKGSTNNMCEIIALWMGIYKAINMLYTEQLPFQVNLFSDSKVSLFGLRDWIANWITSMKDGHLWTTSGPAMNEEWFVDSYNAIVSSGIKLKYFHQKGHVNINSSRALFEADKMFRTSNNISPNKVGVRPDIFSKYNDHVDKHSRQAIYDLLGKNYLNPETTYFIQGSPMIFEIVPSTLVNYLNQISGGLNYPVYYNGRYS